MKFPDVIKGFQAFVIDGKTYNATEHRIEETHTDAGPPLSVGSFALVGMRHQMFINIQYDANAHRRERKIVEPLQARQLRLGAL